MRKPTKTKKAKRKRVKLTPDQRKRRQLELRYKTDIRTMFINAGFEHIATRDTNITVATRVGDIDGIFARENLLIIVEDTTSAPQHATEHLRQKAEYFRYLKNHTKELIPALTSAFPKFKEYFRKQGFDQREYQIRFVYSSRFDIDHDFSERYIADCTVLPYSSLQYFLSLSRTIRKSARFEIYKFLNIKLEMVGPAKSHQEVSAYSALLLPEIPSGFPDGHKLVSFLIDPETLIERSYVLRVDSWRDQEALYQRLLVRNKITSMRDYLVTEKRVFVNNIIVTLPSETLFAASDRASGDRGDASNIRAGKLTIPRKFNAIGIIDGQHRVFAYHEGEDSLERAIAGLRKRQHLLVTGIIYPQSMSRQRAQVFEARLFLEINDKQKRVRGDLKQSIERLVNPFSSTAVAKAVVEKIAASGPLSGKLEVHFFDTGKLKTTSIVSYGLKNIVAINGEVSLFKVWLGPGKNRLKAAKDLESLDRYTKFCATQLNLLVAGFRASLDDDMWTTDLKKSRVLTTTTINGLIFCMRQLLEDDKLGSDFDYYRTRFAKHRVDFRPAKFTYKSSNWRELGRELYVKCFT